MSLSLSFSLSLAFRLCFFAPASSTARKKINTRRAHRHKASSRRGNYVGPRIMRSCRGRVCLRALRASAPNNKGRTVNDDKWKTSEDLVRKSFLASLLFNAVPPISRLMTLVPRTLATGLAPFETQLLAAKYLETFAPYASKYIVLWVDSPSLTRIAKHRARTRNYEPPARPQTARTCDYQWRARIELLGFSPIVATARRERDRDCFARNCVNGPFADVECKNDYI